MKYQPKAYVHTWIYIRSSYFNYRWTLVSSEGDFPHFSATGWDDVNSETISSVYVPLGSRCEHILDQWHCLISREGDLGHSLLVLVPNLHKYIKISSFLNVTSLPDCQVMAAALRQQSLQLCMSLSHTNQLGQNYRYSLYLQHTQYSINKYNTPTLTYMGLHTHIHIRPSLSSPARML